MQHTVLTSTNAPILTALHPGRLTACGHHAILRTSPVVAAEDARFAGVLAGGTIGSASVLAIAVAIDDQRVAVVREYSPEWDNVRSESQLFEVIDRSTGQKKEGPSHAVRLLEQSTNGTPYASVQSCASRDSSCCVIGGCAQYKSNCYDGSCRPCREVCEDYDLSCVYLACAACAVSCGSGAITCMLCLLAVCAQTTWACCDQSGFGCLGC